MVSLLVFVGTFAVLLGISRAARSLGWWNLNWVPPVIATIPSSDDYYMASYRGGVEHYMVYQGFGGIHEHLKRADVLFLGNSRMQFGWPRESLEPFFASRHLNYYQMGFGYKEPSPLPLAIIRKYDLHPKWVVINVDPFFTDAPSDMGADVLSTTAFEAFKFRLEHIGGFYAQRWVHWVVPALNHKNQPQDWPYFRSIRDGTVLLAASPKLHAPVPPQTWPESDWQKNLAPARAFKAEMDRRKIRMVFTVDPMPSAHTALGLSASLGNVSVLIPDRTNNLYTFDGIHLEADSAKRYADEFLEQFGKLLDEK